MQEPPPSALSCVSKPYRQANVGLGSPKTGQPIPAASEPHPTPGATAGVLPDDGVHAPHLRGALQHTEGLRKGVALVGRGQGSPENQTHGQKVWGRLPEGWRTAHGNNHPPRCHLTLQTHIRGHPAELSEQPALPGPCHGKGTCIHKPESLEFGKPRSPRTCPSSWATDPGS